MPKLLAFLTALILALTAAACGEEEATNTAQEAQEQVEGAGQQAEETAQDAQEQVEGNQPQGEQAAQDIADQTSDLRRDLARAAQGEQLDPDRLEQLEERARELRQRAQDELPQATGEELAQANQELAQVAGELRQAARSGDRAAIERIGARFEGLQRSFRQAADALEQRYPGAREAAEVLRKPVPALEGR